MSTNVVLVLNDLVETSKDGEKGFLKAAEDTRDPSLKLLFQSRAEACSAGARELQELVQRLGGKPETGGSMAGALHRGYVDVKSTVTGHSDHAVLAECERGEDVAKKNYRQALDKDLPADVRAVVERQYSGRAGKSRPHPRSARPIRRRQIVMLEAVTLQRKRPFEVNCTPKVGR
ncbi:hypothetical protein BRCH_02141c [Candidatus Burkholderia brachyanthoides]|nr:hypothetical protein BRCH_02141c [Candidatus Burkholderia brachyanthoides]